MTDETRTVLVVEDDELTRTFLADNLTADGYEVLVAGVARDAVRALEQHRPHLVLLDLGLPDHDGLQLLRRLRAGESGTRANPATPVLVLSGRAGELDKLRGFERGCDDYLSKPFSYAELRARVRALLRRTEHRGRPRRIRHGALDIDLAGRRVTVAGQAIELSQKEYALLLALAGEPLRVFTKDELLAGVWGYRSRGSTRTLDSHASRLRRKLSVDGHMFVRNVWGVGYRLADPLDAAA